MPDNYVVNTKEASGFIMVSNLSITYAITNSIHVYALAQNLFDRENRFPLSIDGYFIPMRGRVVNLGVTARL
jgi:hypothetical protein